MSHLSKYGKDNGEGSWKYSKVVGVVYAWCPHSITWKRLGTVNHHLGQKPDQVLQQEDRESKGGSGSKWSLLALKDVVRPLLILQWGLKI